MTDIVLFSALALVLGGAFLYIVWPQKKRSPPEWIPAEAPLPRYVPISDTGHIKFKEAATPRKADVSNRRVAKRPRRVLPSVASSKPDNSGSDLLTGLIIGSVLSGGHGATPASNNDPDITGGGGTFGGGGASGSWDSSPSDSGGSSSSYDSGSSSSSSDGGSSGGGGDGS